eukprot:751206-Hanusia_phi.AAC.2
MAELREGREERGGEERSLWFVTVFCLPYIVPPQVQEIRKQFREMRREVEVVKINGGQEAENERKKQISELKVQQRPRSLAAADACAGFYMSTPVRG